MTTTNPNNRGYSFREKIRNAKSYEEALVYFNQAYTLASERTVRRCAKIMKERWPKGLKSAKNAKQDT